MVSSVSAKMVATVFRLFADFPDLITILFRVDIFTVKPRWKLVID